MPCHLKLSAAQLDLVADYVELLGAVGVRTDTKTVWEARVFCSSSGHCWGLLGAVPRPTVRSPVADPSLRYLADRHPEGGG